VATVALVLMNLVPRESLNSADFYGDEDSDVSLPLSLPMQASKQAHVSKWFCLESWSDICICQSKAATRHASDAVCVDMQTKARIWLFCSYLVSFGAVAGAGAVFISSVQHHKHVPMGVVSRAASHKPNACSYLSSIRYGIYT